MKLFLKNNYFTRFIAAVMLFFFVAAGEGLAHCQTVKQILDKIVTDTVKEKRYPAR
jgi:hypothetical protein